jgi:polar amino acid transport system substrate-binding protein
MPGRRLGSLAGVAVLVAVVAGCSTGSDTNAVSAAISQAAKQPAAIQGAPASGSTAAAATSCSPAADTSYPPSSTGSFPSGSLQATVKARGFLVVGVSGDTRLLGARNLLADKEPLEGFDISIANAIASALGVSVRYKVITAGDRFPQVNAGYNANTGNGVDLVARAVSMTCDRWKVAKTDPSKGSLFSVAYLQAKQRVLGDKKTYPSVAALMKAKPSARICAPVGSTSLANISKIGAAAVPVQVAIHSDCLALWQEGKVDAITGDDVILAGFQAQDPSAGILDSGSFDTTPYGLAISANHPEFVQYVNAVMASQAFKDAWNVAYQANLAAALKDAPQSFPAPNYTRPAP